MMEEKKVSLFKLLGYFWEKKLKIALFIFLVASISVVFLLIQANKYTSKSVFTAVNKDSEGGLASLASSFGGVASLAGLDLSNSGANTVEAEFLLNSESFLVQLVKDEKLLTEVVASKGFDFQSNEIKLDEEMFNGTNWLLEGDELAKEGGIPANWLIASKVDDMVSVSKDDMTGLFTLKVEHHSPYFAQQFSNLLLDKVNSTMREREALRTNKRLDFLYAQLNQTQNKQIQSSIYSLIEQQLQQKMMFDTDEDYIFRVIDSPSLPELKSSPMRAILLILIVIIATIFIIFLYTLRFAFKEFSAVN